MWPTQLVLVIESRDHTIRYTDIETARLLLYLQTILFEQLTISMEMTF